MKNNILKFKTNINCMGCVSKVTPELNKIMDVNNWEVDISNRDRILTINTQSDNENKIISAVEKAGFKIEKI